jgi:hypothetical protein
MSTPTYTQLLESFESFQNDSAKAHSIVTGDDDETVLIGQIEVPTFRKAIKDFQDEADAAIEGIEGGGPSTVIADNLTTQSALSALSANQGFVLKGIVDSIDEQISTLQEIAFRFPNNVRSDFSNPYSYIGSANYGTANSSVGWTIKRIQITSSGSTTTLSASGTWTNRAALTYS